MAGNVLRTQVVFRRASRGPPPEPFAAASSCPDGFSSSPRASAQVRAGTGFASHLGKIPHQTAARACGIPSRRTTPARDLVEGIALEESGDEPQAGALGARWSPCGDDQLIDRGCIPRKNYGWPLGQSFDDGTSDPPSVRISPRVKQGPPNLTPGCFSTEGGFPLARKKSDRWLSPAARSASRSRTARTVAEGAFRSTLASAMSTRRRTDRSTCSPTRTTAIPASEACEVSEAARRSEARLAVQYRLGRRGSSSKVIESAGVPRQPPTNLGRKSAPVVRCHRERALASCPLSSCGAFLVALRVWRDLRALVETLAP